MRMSSSCLLPCGRCPHTTAAVDTDRRDTLSLLQNDQVRIGHQLLRVRTLCVLSHPSSGPPAKQGCNVPRSKSERSDPRGTQGQDEVTQEGAGAGPAEDHPPLPPDPGGQTQIRASTYDNKQKQHGCFTFVPICRGYSASPPTGLADLRRNPTVCHPRPRRFRRTRCCRPTPWRAR